MALKDIIFRVDANTKNAEKNMDKLEKKSSSLVASFKKLGLGISAAFAARFVLNSYLDQEKALTQLNTVLKSTGGIAGVTAKDMTELAKSLSGVTRFSDEAIIGAENILLTFTKIGKDVLPTAIETILDMSEALGTDLKGQAIQLGKALNDPIKGVSALQEVGVSLSVEQKKLVESFIKVNDIAGAQKVILDELKVEFGNSAKAAGQTLGGQLDQLQNKIADTAAELVKGFLPALKNLVSILSTAVDWALKLKELLPAFTSDMVNTPEQLAKLTSKQLNAIQEAFGDSRLSAAIVNLNNTTVEGIQKISQELAGMGDELANMNKEVTPLEKLQQRIAELRDELTKPLTQEQKLQIEINKLEKELADKIAGNVAAREKSLITTNKQIEEEIKALQLAQSKTSEIREQLLYQQKIVELQKELDKFSPSFDKLTPKTPGIVPPFTLRSVNVPERKELPFATEEELREQFKEFDIIANASAETFKETFSGVLDELFGDNSILQKFLSKTFGGFLDQMASNLGRSVFSGLLSLLPGGSFLSGLFSGGAGRAKATAGGGTLMIQNNIAGEEINTVMVDLVPTALNRAARLRRA